MEVFEKGVSSQSAAYFHTHSVLAGELFFYPLCAGHFYCDRNYSLARTSYDSFLIIYVADGSGYLSIGSEPMPVHKGSLLFLDCYQPHSYGTSAGWEIYWLHFDGTLARRYFEQCTPNGAYLFDDAMEAASLRLVRIWEAFCKEEKPGEALLSKWITGLLTELLLCRQGETGQTKSSDAIDHSLHFIAENISQPLLLEELAQNVSLSPFYFSRLFKKRTGFTPHEYVVRARVDRAKYLLKTTQKPLKEIASCCGFSNACNFSSVFKKASGETPLSYRNHTD